MSNPTRSDRPTIRVAADGNPFKSDKDALEFMRANNLTKLQPYPYRGGWCLSVPGLTEDELDPKREEREQDEKRVKDMKKAEATTEKFYRVTIHGSDQPDAQTTVLLSNGIYYLQVQRGPEVILPQGLVDVLRQATNDKFQVIPGYGRKVAQGAIPRFPYTIGGEASRADFEAFLRTGNAQQERDIKAMEAHTLTGLVPAP